VATKMEQVAVDEAQSLVRQVAWRALQTVTVLIAHEAANFLWRRMTGKPPPTHRRRGRGL
jgi:ribosomal protein L31E